LQREMLTRCGQLWAEWPDEFVKNLPKMSPNPFLAKISVQP
jgi:hypothetical protein